MSISFTIYVYTISLQLHKISFVNLILIKSNYHSETNQKN